MKGIVYLLEDNEMGLYKIGVTKNLIEDRISKLLTGNPSNIYLINTFETDEPFKMEKMLHRCYSKKHYNNEWFLLDIKDIDNWVDNCIKYLKIIDSLKENPYFK